ncbi:MAG: hypothetical protein AUK47_10810 [Deltaproteobacteria bacterium CG2_30_63_29]|nr:MAG: hypothetical protein AUK47_10810 [Deltaproteobacteria bacterium CG2_30_63_29]
MPSSARKSNLIGPDVCARIKQVSADAGRRQDAVIVHAMRAWARDQSAESLEFVEGQLQVGCAVRKRCLQLETDLCAVEQLESLV